ncbi:hypothetical protein BD414DRAFT_474843 [Trametes punicea]|nr:hypothetical protein BD414DRAFT_474843 [Trametes punicea]
MPVAAVALHATDALQRLDNDCLRIIFELLRPTQDLHSLSLTCKWLREACMPVLFHTCTVRSFGIDRPDGPSFLPRTLWPHVCVLIFSGSFSRPDLPRYTDEDFSPFDPERKLAPLRRIAAAKQVGQCLRDVLHSMPALHTIYVFTPHGDIMVDPLRPLGLSWYVLEALLSSPLLRHFSISGPLCNAGDELPEDVQPPVLSPLSTFEYLLRDQRDLPRASNMEKEGMPLILSRLHDHLERLVLPSESTPFDMMHLWEWSALRELSLRGEAPSSSLPLVQMLSKMPRLRELSLLLAQPANASPQPIWPRSLPYLCEWRDLEDLTVAHPHPEDEIYAHLPRSLRRLALRCWPRYYKHHTGFNKDLLEAGVHWSSPLLSSSEMLHIMRKIDAPYLRHLELEFRADGDGNELFRYVATAFPRLSVLRVHRYRASGETKVPLAAIAAALSTLGNLRLIMLHLDFDDLPDVDVYQRKYYSDPQRRPQRKEQVRTSNATLLHAANLFARRLSSSLEYICLLMPLHNYIQQWVPFRVIRSTGGETGNSTSAERLPVPTHGFDALHDYSIREDD